MLKLRIITPERIMLETEVDSVTLPTQSGQITILPKHILMAANLNAGEIVYKKAGVEDFFAVSGGVLEIKPNDEVIILADAAEFAHEIDIDRAEQARQRAQKIMTQTYVDEKSYADAVAAMEKHLTRIKIARKHRTHTHKNLESGTL